jgi:hypothetical protein
MSLVEHFPITEADEQVANCIDRGLERIGPNVKYLVYWHLQNIGHIKRFEIVSNPEKFSGALKRLYRESAAAVERAIVQELNASFGMSYNPDELIPAMKEAQKRSEQIRVI